MLTKIVEKFNLKKKQKGAALIIALLVITAVAGITFFSSRLSIKEIIVMSKFEDSMNAYYTAEAGVEQGLLMWKYNHDVEYSDRCLTPGCSDKPTETHGSPVQVVIDANRSYGLKIWHNNDPSADPSVLKKDDVAQFDITGLNITIYCDSGCDILGANPYEHALEWYIIDSNNSVIDKGMITATGHVNPLPGKTVRLRSWGNDKTYRVTSGGDRIDSQYTTIESTGKFRDTQRKLQVKIDRNSGKVLSIFDFFLFGGTQIEIQ